MPTHKNWDLRYSFESILPRGVCICVLIVCAGMYVGKAINEYDKQSECAFAFGTDTESNSNACNSSYKVTALKWTLYFSFSGVVSAITALAGISLTVLRNHVTSDVWSRLLISKIGTHISGEGFFKTARSAKDKATPAEHTQGGQGAKEQEMKVYPNELSLETSGSSVSLSHSHPLPHSHTHEGDTKDGPLQSIWQH